MTYRLLSTLLLMSLLSTAADAVAGALNDVCISGSNTCTDTTNNVCDTNRATALCKAKVGVTCSVDDDCVAGSSCTGAAGSKTCGACQGSTASSSLCNPDAGYLGGTCACTAANTECTNSKCVCKSGYSAVYSSYSCLANLGTTCSADADCYDSTNNVCDSVANACKIRLTKVCTGNTDKCVTKASCTGTSNTTCACNTGYTMDGTICKASLGTTCSADSDCADIANTMCDLVAKVCRIEITKTCTGNADKCVTGAACTGSGSTCACGSTYTDATTYCKPNLGTACFPTSSLACNGVDNVCDPYSSTCKIGSTKACTSGETKCTTGATCTTSGASSTCLCDTTTYTADTTNYLCQKKVTAGATCTYADKCSDTDTVCDLQLGKCVKKQAGACSATDTCVSGATCVSSKCACASGFTITNTDFCAATVAGKAGGACSSGACTDTNAECKTTPAYGSSANTACYCKTNFQINTTDGKCTAQSAASSLSKVAGFVTVLAAVYLGFHL